jgi:hypothetical protein
MSSGAQVDLDWAGTDVAAGEAGASPADGGAAGVAGVGAGLGAGARGGTSDARYLTDEEILGITPVGGNEAGRDSSGRDGAANREDAALGDKGAQAEAYATEAGGPGGPMPSWMAAAAADPRNGAEARALWSEHQEFRAAFASPVEARAVAEEARAIKELLPGGVRDVVSLREATQSVERIDAALFSGDVRAQSEVVAEMARVNPAAFRSMFAEAARVLAGMGEGGRSQVAGGREGRNLDGAFANGLNAGPTLREGREGWGTQTEIQNPNQNQNQNPNQIQNRRQDAGATNSANQPSQGLRASESQITDHGARATEHGTRNFDPAAYAAFERATNDAVARDVRGSIGDTLARVMPEGVADGAARRIGEDIFTEVHRALAADAPAFA